MFQPAWITIIFVFAMSNLILADSPKFIIVGAGLAGVSAAAKLIENGYGDVVILEAENRMGGRIQSVPFSNGTIDLGAQWCHGEKDNAVYEMVHEHFSFGSLGAESKSLVFALSNGHEANQETCTLLLALLDSLFETSLEGTRNESLGTYMTREYQKALETPKYSQIDKVLSDQMLVVYHKRMNSFYATESWFDISVYYNMFCQECEGDTLLTWKTKGFKMVFDFITKKLPDPSKKLDVESKIQLNKEVSNIKWNPEVATGNVKVSCTDGSSYSADHVIFTASLGVLKDRHRTLFTPNLPADKIKAIDNIGFGTLGKFFLEFDEPFWPADDDKWVGYSFLWKDEDVASFLGSDKEWLLSVNGFYRVDAFPNIIEGLISGDKISTFETISEDQLLTDCMWLLERFLAKSLPRATNIIRNQWQTNKNFLGSYSYPSMNSEREEATPMMLAQSMLNIDKKPVVLFAGEATHEKYSGYTHGAIQSGWRAGNEIIEFYKNKIERNKFL